MATYTQLQQGSKGSDVTKLQEALKSAGYGSYLGSYGADGIYGSHTAGAVKAYQKDNNLTVDGIAGNQTLGHLYSRGSADTGPTIPAVPDTKNYTYNPKDNLAYAQSSAAAQQAYENLAALENPYAAYEEQLRGLYDQYVNREDFTYDVNADALYQQYKDQYTRQGQLAMMDTMGQAAALTGGYGSSYAQNVGQQAYQSYLQQLNDVVPELYGMAYDRYQQEGEALLNRYALLGDMADGAYSRYRDQVNDGWQKASYLQSQADNAYERGYQNWYNALQMGLDARQTAKDELISLITSTGYTPTDRELQAAGMTRQQANAYGNYYAQKTTTASSGTSYGDSYGGDLVLPDPKQTAATDKFLAQYGYYETWRQRGLTENNWNAMWKSALNNIQLSDGEYRYIEEEIVRRNGQ